MAGEDSKGVGVLFVLHVMCTIPAALLARYLQMKMWFLLFIPVIGVVYFCKLCGVAVLESDEGRFTYTWIVELILITLFCVSFRYRGTLYGDIGWQSSLVAAFLVCVGDYATLLAYGPSMGTLWIFVPAPITLWFVYFRWRRYFEKELLD